MKVQTFPEHIEIDQLLLLLLTIVDKPWHQCVASLVKHDLLSGNEVPNSTLRSSWLFRRRNAARFELDSFLCKLLPV